MMQPGVYYVGDICYVMHPQWREVCDLTIIDHHVLHGEFELASGVRFATQSTACGDGVYQDQQGRNYPVDAGLIGCVRVEDVADPDAWLEGVHIVKFENPFEVVEDSGLITFVEHLPNGVTVATLGIDTDPELDEEEEQSWD